MHRINSEFDKVVCINLVERKDKKEKIQKRFDNLGIEVEWHTAVKYGFIPRIVPFINNNEQHFNPRQPFEMGCALSHYHVVKQALEEGAERLFVFEDDALFHKEFNKKFNSYFNTLPKDWDQFLLYSFMYEWLPKNTRVNARWVKSYRSWSLMSHGIKKNMMKGYIVRQDAFFTISDKVTFDMQEENVWNIYSAIPSLCLPDSKMGSNIRGENMNYATNPTVTNWGIPNENYE